MLKKWPFSSPSILSLASCLMLYLFNLQLIISSIPPHPPCYLSLADVHSQPSLSMTPECVCIFYEESTVITIKYAQPSWLEAHAHNLRP